MSQLVILFEIDSNPRHCKIRQHVQNELFQ